MRFEFVVRSGKEVGRTVALTTGQTITLGRLKGCDVVSTTKPHHDATARSPRARTCACVTDLQSANGTFVNERRITTSELEKGDKIRIGSTVSS